MWSTWEGGGLQREYAGPRVRAAAGVFVSFGVVSWLSWTESGETYREEKKLF